MTYIPINELLAKAKAKRANRQNKPLTNATMLPVGMHEATISSVDTSRYDSNGTVLVTFTALAGRQIESIFVSTREGDAFSSSFDNLLTGLFAERDDAFDMHAELMEYDFAEAIQALRGFKTNLFIKAFPGYVVEGLNADYTAVDVISGEVLAVHPNSITAVKKLAEAKGHKESRNRMNYAEAAQHLDSNIEALRFAHASILGATGAQDTTQPKLVRS